MATDASVVKRLEAIERELAEIRKQLKPRSTVAKRRSKPKLYGMLKGLEITDDDIAEAKHSLFRDVKGR